MSNHIEEKCDETYETEFTEECSYETVLDKKCSRSYSVTYKSVTERECKLFGNFLCENIEKVKCKKVPQFPSQKCQNVPRLEELCKLVPVQRHWSERSACAALG